MTTTYIGSLEIGVALPGATAAAEAGAGGINVAFPDVAGRLAALQAQILALATMPPLPSFADMLVSAQALVASINLAISTPGLPPAPSLDSAIVALQALVTELAATSATLSAQLALIVDFQTRLAFAGVHVVKFDGDLSTLGAELQAAVSAHASGTGHALARVTTNTATWGAMGAVFKVTP